MQASKTLNRSSLILFNPADQTILGELSDAELKEETGSNGINYVLSGIAGDGTMETLKLFSEQGLDTVRYEFSDGKVLSGGEAFLLRPSKMSESTGTEVRIESPTKPAASRD